MPPAIKPIAAKLWSRVKKGGTNECWPWTGRTTRGYGRIQTGGRGTPTTAAHRLAFTLSCYQAIEGLEVCHSCDNPSCCNPAHLFPGTRLENQRDMASKGRAARGSRHPNAKLSEGVIIDLRRKWESGGFSMRELAKAFGVSTQMIWMILTKQSWKHL